MNIALGVNGAAHRSRESEKGLRRRLIADPEVDHVTPLEMEQGPQHHDS